MLLGCQKKLKKLLKYSICKAYTELAENSSDAIRVIVESQLVHKNQIVLQGEEPDIFIDRVVGFSGSYFILLKGRDYDVRPLRGRKLGPDATRGPEKIVRMRNWHL